MSGADRAPRSEEVGTFVTSPGSASSKSLRESADALANLAVWHWHDFKQFRILYYHSAEQLESLNAVAPGFFADLHRWLIDRIVLNVQKMLDGPRTMGKENLTVPALHELCRVEQRYPTAEAEVLIRTLRAHASPIENWRHHLVAHIDRAAALSTPPAQYEFVPSNVEEFYQTLDIYFALVYRSLWDTVFPLNATSQSDSYELIRAIRDGAIMAELLERDVLAYDRLHHESRFGRH